MASNCYENACTSKTHWGCLISEKADKNGRLISWGFFLLKLIYKKKLQISQVQARSSMSSLCIVRIRIICRSDKGVLQAAPQIAYNLLSKEMKNGNTYIYICIITMALSR